MAQRIVTVAVDDVDGTELDGSDHVAVRFSINGKNYEMDLSHDNWEAFQEVLSPYVNAARPVKQAAKRSASHSLPDPRAVREWAVQNGYEVSDRGRIPFDVYQAYREVTGRK